MKIIIYLMIIISFSTCQSDIEKSNQSESTGKTTNDEINNLEFSEYLAYFRKTELPIVIGNFPSVDFNNTSVQAFNNDEFTKAYAQIPTSEEYIALITERPSDPTTWVLTTYTLTGQIIDEKIINIGQCYTDCGYSCSEYITIKDDYTIFSSDTIISYECDYENEANPVPETYQYYVIYKEGKLMPDGKIQLSELITKPLKERVSNVKSNAIEFIESLKTDKKMSLFFDDNWNFEYHRDHRSEGSTDGQLGNLKSIHIDSIINLKVLNHGENWDGKKIEPKTFSFEFDLKKMIAKWDRIEVDYNYYTNEEDNIVYIAGAGASDFIKLHYNEDGLIIKFEYRSEDPG